MKAIFKITSGMRERILTDLRRSHQFAKERVGFVSTRLGNREGDEILVLATDFIVIPDEHYVVDPYVGARIGSAAILSGMQHVLDTDEGMFHVHLHDWNGVPSLGTTDRREIPPIINTFRNIGPKEAHGILLFSSDNASCEVWLPGGNELLDAQVSVVGHPLRVFGRQV